jgi:hypothetical protein
MLRGGRTLAKAGCLCGGKAHLNSVSASDRAANAHAFAALQRCLDRNVAADIVEAQLL